jgi:hypothetical protein
MTNECQAINCSLHIFIKIHKECYKYIQGDTMRKCSKCGVEKEISCFGKDKHNKKDGLRYACKECLSIERKQKWSNITEEEKQNRYRRLRKWRNALPVERREKLNSKMRIGNMTDDEKERRRQQARESKARRPKEIMVSHAKSRATEKGIDFDITTDDIQIPDVCPVLGIPLIRGNGKRTDNSPTLDRIDNSKGYVKGNVMVISHRANLLKNSASIQEVELILEYMKKHQAKDAAAERIV